MGTRGAVGFRIDGTDRVTYNHYDSYPSGLGEVVVAFCKRTKDIDLAPFVRGIRLVDQGVPPRQSEIEKYRQQEFDGSMSSGRLQDWYCLLRKTQGQLDFYLEGLDVMLDSHEFLADSLFCEWAYIINLDEGVLEVYRGFNENPKAPGRYAGLREGDYCGVALVKSVPLKDIDAFDIKTLG